MTDRKLLRFRDRREQAREAVLDALADSIALATEKQAKAVAITIITGDDDVVPIMAGESGLVALIGALEIAKACVLDEVEMTPTEVPGPVEDDEPDGEGA